MSLERTPMRSQTIASGCDPVNICSICTEALLEDQNCVIVQECCHAFHRVCAETSLATSAECPVCKRSCQLSELQRYLFPPNNNPIVESPNLPSFTKNPTNAPMSKPYNKGKPRGAKAYNTRSHSRTLFNESQNSGNHTQEFDHTEPSSRPQMTAERSSAPANSQQIQQNNPVVVDYNLINRMIEQTMTQLLSSLNMLPSTRPRNQETISATNPSARISFNLEQDRRPSPGLNQGNVYNPNSQNRFSPIPCNVGSNVNGHSNVSSSLRLPYTVDKISSIIQGWNLKFDGSQSGLNVEEFLYRVQSLTMDTFEGDFNVICKNLQILLSGRAREWLWRYRKQVQAINWETFCQAIRSQYGDFKTSSDLREEIRNRKQKTGETFDVFFDAISAIIDRLDTPMPETEVIETLTRNLRPEIRQELLYIPVRSVSHLRQLVHKRENFLNDEHVRRNMGVRHNNAFLPRRQVAEVDLNEISDDFDPDLEPVNSVNALQASSYNSQCWNCDSSGHHWQDCLQERQVFCYGCGAKKVYKPNCSKCQTKFLTMPKNYKPVVPTKEQL